MIHGGKLPHWQQARVCVFVTFRLSDSIPRHLLTAWEAERKAWLTRHPEPRDPALSEAFHRSYTTRIEEWLDRGQGSCLLRSPDVAKILEGVLHEGDGQICVLHGWVIMPNHVHLLFSPTTRAIEDVLKAWKGTSARRINLALDRVSSTVWMKGYHDRLIRDGEHFRRCVNYIRTNPMKAGLADHEYLHFEGDLVKRLVPVEQ